MNLLLRAVAALAVGALPLAAQSVQRLDQVVVTATRTPQPPARVAATTAVLDATTLATTPTATLDSALRSVPSFSLFRRSDSLTANPTTQGVSLRGLGPSGASRSLVLLDGIPLNDPFGGWVNWGQLSRDAIERIELVPGGGATAWGNSALGGVVQVFGRVPSVDGMSVGRGLGSAPGGERSPRPTEGIATAMAGGFETRSADAVIGQSLGGFGAIQLTAEDFTTAGFPVIAESQRGTVDVAAWTRHRNWSAQWRKETAGNVTVAASIRGFEELRGNGTPYQRNGTRSKVGTVRVDGQPSTDFSWSAAAYAQDQSYASTFSAVNAARTAETPASDQYAVPTSAAGVSWSGAWHTDRADTGFGVDARTVHGETRENFSFSNGTYTRQRVAGGAQTFAGLFVVHEQQLGPTVRLTLGARGDAWLDERGHRWEVVRATGAIARDERYPSHRGNEFSPSAGAVWTPNEIWRFHASGQRAFRRPTLNELYRPFRQGANVTEANADLKTETDESAEVGVEAHLGRGPHRAGDEVGFRPGVVLGATAFWNELHDAVTNVTVARGPGTFPLFGTLPAGGVGRQRLNIDRVRVQGVELSAAFHATESFSLTAALLYDDAEVQRAAVAPNLVGKRLPEVPRHSASLMASYRAPAAITITPRVRWIGRQFDDDENTLRLGELVVVDVGVTWAATRWCEVFVNAENVGNTCIETARTADGVVSVGTPRFVFGGVRVRW
jgi:outer membrane cobalamin receptor